jgi:hypothetical protein
LDAGISKSVSPRARRTTIGGVIGDKVFIPGSPATTLPELLQEAEVNLDSHVGLPNTPTKELQPRHIYPGTIELGLGHDARNGDSRPWTRDDWKQLDACFTDERLDVGARTDQGESILANVDDVQVADVVARFVAVKGGAEMMNGFGTEWTLYVTGILYSRATVLIYD